MIGSLLVIGGAVSYSVLATLVKLAYQSGFTAEEVTFSQYLAGVVTFGVINLIQRKSTNDKVRTIEGKNTRLKLVVGRTTIGFTGIFYYFSVEHLPVSAADAKYMARCIDRKYPDQNISFRTKDHR